MLEFQFFMSKTKADASVYGYSRYAIFTETWTVPNRTSATGSSIFNHYNGAAYHIGGQHCGNYTSGSYIRSAYPGSSKVVDTAYDLNTKILTITSSGRYAYSATSDDFCIPYRIYGWKF